MFSPALRPRSKLLRAGLQTFSHGPLRRRSLPRNARWLTSPASPEHAKGPLPGQQVDNEFAEAMGFMMAYVRSLETARVDRIINDPFAEPLSRKARPMLEGIVDAIPEQRDELNNFVAVRDRYVDEALNQRDPEICQVVILGAGMDARAYHLESLRGCHVLEIDQGAQLLGHKRKIIQELHVPSIAEKVEYIIADLAVDDWGSRLLACNFDKRKPTFWVMEGLLPYLDRPSNVTLLKTVDTLSAPGSELWADMAGEMAATAAEMGTRRASYGEDDPMHGVLSEIPWRLELQASLGTTGTHFGRDWTPIQGVASKRGVPFFYVLGKKPHSS
ncbi:hypothetical protein BBJ28_00020560 [Nothophytophthora sp. Chile5]|nr:hypothetical protein BBJ28_00020560 [Nothophytophthora sp. Chile5]